MMKKILIWSELSNWKQHIETGNCSKKTFEKIHSVTNIEQNSNINNKLTGSHEVLINNKFSNLVNGTYLRVVHVL